MHRQTVALGRTAFGAGSDMRRDTIFPYRFTDQGGHCGDETRKSSKFVRGLFFW
jgi:hypothetical protein